MPIARTRSRRSFVGSPATATCVLDPFSESEVADYVTERSPAIATDEAFVRALHQT
jgi:hypothetical protein